MISFIDEASTSASSRLLLPTLMVI
jgi:hypothetical protein